MPTINSVIEELKKSGVNSKAKALEMLEELQKQQSNPTEFEKWLREEPKRIENTSDDSEEISFNAGYTFALKDALSKYQSLTKDKIVLVLDKEEVEIIKQAVSNSSTCEKCKYYYEGEADCSKCIQEVILSKLEVKE
jgi:hypothetical protein